MNKLSFLIATVWILGGIHGLSAQPHDTIRARLMYEEAVVLQKRYKPQEALPILHEILDIYLKNFGERSEEVARIYYNLGNCGLDLAEYDEALAYLNQSLDIRLEILGPEAIVVGDTYVLIGIYYDYMAKYDRAIGYYDQALEVYRRKLPENDQRIGVVYNSVGICLFFKGDVGQSLLYFKRAVAMTIENRGLKSLRIISELNNVSLCHSELKNYLIAREDLKVASISMLSNNLLHSTLGARVLHSKGLTHLGLEEYDKAMEYFVTALNTRLDVSNRDHPEIATSHYVIGLCYFETGDLDKALMEFKEALRINLLKLGENHPEAAICLAKIAEMYTTQKQYKKALNAINASLEKFTYQTSSKEDPDYNKQILEALDVKARLHHLLFKQNKNIEDLEIADQTYTQLITLINKFKVEFKEENSKEVLAEQFYHVFDDAIEVSYKRYELNKNKQFLLEAFQRCEYSSSFILLEALRNSKAKYFAGIPDSLLEKERQLKVEITFNEKEKYEEEKILEERDLNIIAQLDSKIFKLKQEHYTLIQQFEQNYPHYYRLKYDLNTVAISTVQTEVLDHDQAILEYFVGEESIFVFIITPDNFLVKKIKKTFPLEEWVAELRDNIIRFQYPFNLPNHYHLEFVIAAGDLYKELIDPFKDILPPRLIIIPGSVLASIPFESFVIKAAEPVYHYKDHQYLIHDYAISYCYSSTLLEEMVNKRTQKANENFIAFAPSFGVITRSFNLRSMGLSPLVYNIPEAERVSNLAGGGEVITGRNATEDYFTDNSQKYNMVHLATHGNANDVDGDYNFLAFSEVFDSLENEYLFTKDVYNIFLNSDMVTLSACETGIGELRRGEGVISLARSFSYAGAGCINTTLWKVVDDKALRLMELFYENIKKGETKDQALRKAKLSYLEEFDEMSVHPFFWTPFISIGDMQAINNVNSWWPPNWLPVLFVLLLLFLFYRNKLKKT